MARVKQSVGSAVNWSETNGEQSGLFGLRVLVVPLQVKAKATMSVTLRDRWRGAEQ